MFANLAIFQISVLNPSLTCLQSMSQITPIHVLYISYPLPPINVLSISYQCPTHLLSIFNPFPSMSQLLSVSSPSPIHPLSIYYPSPIHFLSISCPSPIHFLSFSYSSHFHNLSISYLHHHYQQLSLTYGQNRIQRCYRI